LLLTAYKNSGRDIDLYNSIIEMIHRGKSVPGGACGAAISLCVFVSIISKSTLNY